jgi:hypothetical protein
MEETQEKHIGQMIATMIVFFWPLSSWHVQTFAP